MNRFAFRLGRLWCIFCAISSAGFSNRPCVYRKLFFRGRFCVVMWAWLTSGFIRTHVIRVGSSLRPRYPIPLISALFPRLANFTRWPFIKLRFCFPTNDNFICFCQTFRRSYFRGILVFVRRRVGFNARCSCFVFFNLCSRKFLFVFYRLRVAFAIRYRSALFPIRIIKGHGYHV